MAMLVKVDGTTEEFDMSADPDQLRTAQKLVGGYVTALRSTDGSALMLVDEDGLMKQLPANAMATGMARAAFGYTKESGGVIVGNALIVEAGVEFSQ